MGGMEDGKMPVLNLVNVNKVVFVGLRRIYKWAIRNLSILKLEADEVGLVIRLAYRMSRALIVKMQMAFHPKYFMFHYL